MKQHTNNPPSPSGKTSVQDNGQRPEITMPIVLSIAGSDCSGGAGIQADIKTISALGGYAAAVITAITAQNTLGVQAVSPVPADMVGRQIESVMSDLDVGAVKIGMVYDEHIVHAIAGQIARFHPRHVVYDPVMVSTSGRKLMTDTTIRAIEEELFPQCTLLTPNLGEAGILLGQHIGNAADMAEAARELSARFCTSVLLKGGHLEGNDMCDVLHHQGREYLFTCRKVESPNLHGTGCTLSSAIATQLAQGCNMPQAVDDAKRYTLQAIAYGKDLHVGHGNGPLRHFFE